MLEELDLLDFWIYGNVPDDVEWVETIQDRIAERENREHGGHQFVHVLNFEHTTFETALTG